MKKIKSNVNYTYFDLLNYTYYTTVIIEFELVSPVQIKKNKNKNKKCKKLRLNNSK